MVRVLYLGRSRAGFITQLPLKPKETAIGKSDSAFDFGTDVVVHVHCGAEIDEVLDYLEVSAAHCDALSETSMFCVWLKARSSFSLFSISTIGFSKGNAYEATGSSP